MRLRQINYKYLVATAFLFGLFMDLMDLTIVNVALPTLGRQFHVTSAATLEWAVTGYLLSLAIWIPASGWIGDRFGTKRTFLFALAMFTFGSVLCGLSQSIGQLIAFRILQGVGGGMMTPVGTAMLFRAFPPKERARAALILTVPTVIAPALGPVVGGLLVDYVSWRWIFFVNVPIGIVGFVFSLVCLREHTEPATGRFDVWGFLFSGAGLALILFALSKAPTEGWGSGAVMGTGFAGIACVVLLVIVELRTAQPMLELRLFADRMFRSATVVAFAAFATLIGLLFTLSLFLQQARGYSAIQTGLLLLPQAAGTMLFSQVTGRLYPLVGPRRLLMSALALMAASSTLFLLVDLQTSLWWIVAIMFLSGMGLAFVFIPLQASTFATISPANMGRASSFYSTNRQVAASFGVAILGTVLASRITTHLSAVGAAAGPAAKQAAAQNATLLAFHDTFAVAVIFGIVGVLSAWFIHDADAAETMRQRAAGMSPAD